MSGEHELAGPTVEIFREPRARDALSKYEVLIDHEFIAKISSGQTVVAPVSPGLHDVEIRVPYFTLSGSTAVEVDGNDRCVIRCYPRPSVLLGPVGPLAFFGSRYLTITQQGSIDHGASHRLRRVELSSRTSVILTFVLLVASFAIDDGGPVRGLALLGVVLAAAGELIRSRILRTGSYGHALGVSSALAFIGLCVSGGAMGMALAGMGP